MSKRRSTRHRTQETLRMLYGRKASKKKEKKKSGSASSAQYVMPVETDELSGDPNAASSGSGQRTRGPESRELRRYASRQAREKRLLEYRRSKQRKRQRTQVEGEDEETDESGQLSESFVENETSSKSLITGEFRLIVICRDRVVFGSHARNLPVVLPVGSTIDLPNLRSPALALTTAGKISTTTLTRENSIIYKLEIIQYLGESEDIVDTMVLDGFSEVPQEVTESEW